MTIHGKVSKMDTIQSQKPKPERKDSKWEILNNLESGTQYNIKPKQIEGLLTKKRKWPMKGWHKRYSLIFSTHCNHIFHMYNVSLKDRNFMRMIIFKVY